ncbi:ABC transporter ATP-binding protein [Thermotoga profunda]|uniref:ABC transporter ATP-binding protein n=1 Tax=Thermotoga profunda TaxID=1508420 RepID=UPI000597E13B|nr:ABC transporter ATP-binding protein [Thermotoga profunda]
MVLKVEGLSKSYRNKKAVDNISFEIEQGCIFALLGPNGAGKTTTIKCILGLRKPDSGKIILNGSFAYLPETKELYRYLTVQKMIEISSMITDNFDKQRAFDILQDFQISLKEKIANLSHGMLTQTYMAIVLSQKAEIYFMDEPTWGLDPIMRNKILEMIRQLSYNGSTVFYTSHILAEVEKIADTVAIMVNGKIVEMDHLDDLKEKYVLCVVPKGEKVNGFHYKSTENEDIYVVKREFAKTSTEPATFDVIFEAIVKGVK